MGSVLSAFSEVLYISAKIYLKQRATGSFFCLKNLKKIFIRPENAPLALNVEKILPPTYLKLFGGISLLVINKSVIYYTKR